MENKQFIVVDIGCIECTEETAILGVYPSWEEAAAKHKLGGYVRSGGEHSIEVFEWPPKPEKGRGE